MIDELEREQMIEMLLELLDGTCTYTDICEVCGGLWSFCRHRGYPKVLYDDDAVEYLCRKLGV